MSLKSLLGFSAAVGALAVFAAGCSAAPDGSPTATESSNEALTRICPPPPIPFCPPPLAEEGHCPSICAPGEEWSPTLCHCVPLPDAGPAADSGACTTPEPVGGCGPLRRAPASRPSARPISSARSRARRLRRIRRSSAAAAPSSTPSASDASRPRLRASSLNVTRRVMAPAARLDLSSPTSSARPITDEATDGGRGPATAAYCPYTITGHSWLRPSLPDETIANRS